MHFSSQSALVNLDLFAWIGKDASHSSSFPSCYGGLLLSSKPLHALQFYDKILPTHRAVLLKRFVVSGVNWMPDTEDQYECVSNILVNVTRFKEGRRLLLEPGRGILQVC